MGKMKEIQIDDVNWRKIEALDVTQDLLMPDMIEHVFDAGQCVIGPGVALGFVEGCPVNCMWSEVGLKFYSIDHNNPFDPLMIISNLLDVEYGGNAWEERHFYDEEQNLLVSIKPIGDALKVYYLRYDAKSGIHTFEVGDWVKWHDPAIKQYPRAEQVEQSERLWRVTDVEEESVWIECGYSEAEVLPNELELISRKKR